MALEGPVIELETAFQGTSRKAGDPLPIFATLHGEAVVVVTTVDYRELLALRMRQSRSGLINLRRKVETGWDPRPQLGLSTIERDAEVADWLRARFRGGVTLEQLHAECLAAFGRERTPSRSRIGKYRQKVWRTR